MRRKTSAHNMVLDRGVKEEEEEEGAAAAAAAASAAAAAATTCWGLAWLPTDNKRSIIVCVSLSFFFSR